VTLLRFVEIGKVIENRDGRARIYILPQYARGLKGLEEYSHCIIIYHLHKALVDMDRLLENIDRMRPMAAPHGLFYGVFATRSPHRPNPIGLTVVKLLSVQDNIIHVDGFDGFTGSPILDIKPYTPYDVYVDAQFPQWLSGGGYEEKKKSLIHAYMNDLWGLAESLHRIVEGSGFDVSDIFCSHGNYVRLRGRFVAQKYPLPCFYVKDLCEVLVQIDAVYITTAFSVDSIKKDFIGEVIDHFKHSVEIFGGENFLHTFYPREHTTDIDRIYSDIIDSGEESIQISVKMQHHEFRNVPSVLRAIEFLMRKHNIMLISPVSPKSTL